MDVVGKPPVGNIPVAGGSTPDSRTLNNINLLRVISSMSSHTHMPPRTLQVLDHDPIVRQRVHVFTTHRLCLPYSYI